MTATPWAWPGATIVRAIDGDSIVARLTRDIGFNGSVVFEQRLRLNRINTPPVKTDAGKAALTYVTGMLGLPVDITTLRAYKYGSQTGEWMAEVTLAGGVNLSDALVAAGLAVHWDGTGSRPGG